MSYVRWSTKVVRDCEVCGNEHWVSFPSYPRWLYFQPDPKRWPDVTADDYPRLPNCCCSCWYIYESDRGLEIHHAGAHVCKAEFEDVTLDVEAAREWTPPDGCNFPEVAAECVREWLEELRARPPEEPEP